jgi:hypothetical protein
MADEQNFDALKDLTDFVTIDGGTGPAPATGKTDKTAKTPETAPALVPEQADHPGIALLDIAIEESVRYCEKEHFPPPNLSLWQNFSRGFLNKSLWHYFPTGAEPDSPAICALIGIAGLAVCYTPVIIAFYEQKQRENKEEQKKQIADNNRKNVEMRQARRAAGLDPMTGKPIPASPIPEPETPDPVPVEQTAPALPEWVTTNAQPVPAIRRLTEAEPPAPGMG